MSSSQIAVYSPGIVEYGLCWALQNHLHSSCVATGAASIIVVQHPPVITLGKNSDPSFILFDRISLEKSGVRVFEIDRGGEATLHNPGQIVVYPIIRLQDWSLGPKQYVGILESAIIELLSGEGIEASTDPEYPGVWVGPNKICAVGVRIKERVTLHGLALNVANDLSLFGKIVPCGISTRGVTSVERLLGRKVDLEILGEKLVTILAKVLRSRVVADDAWPILETLRG